MLAAALALVVVYALGAEVARAEDEIPDAARIEAAADAVLAARAAGDADALASLATVDDPDPWLVADELCRRDDHDAAEAFARAAPRAGVEALPAYVEGRRGQGAEAEQRSLVASAEDAYREERYDEAVRRAEAWSGDLDTVVRIRLAHVRGMALQKKGWLDLKLLEPSIAPLRAVGEAAEQLGWLTEAYTMYGAAFWAALYHPVWPAAEAVWPKQLAVAEALGDPRRIAETHTARGHLASEQLDLDRARTYFEQALDGFRSIGDRRGEAGALQNLAGYHSRRGELTRALALEKRALAMLDQLPGQKGLAWALKCLASTHHALGEFPRAMELYERALAIEEQRPRRDGRLAYTLGLLGDLYFDLGDEERALKLHRESLVIREKMNAAAGGAHGWSSIATIHRARGEYEQALECDRRAYDLIEGIVPGAGDGGTMHRIGLDYLGLGRPAEALERFETARARFDAFGLRYSAGRMLRDIGHAKVRLGRWEEGLTDIDLAVREAHSKRDVTALMAGLELRARLLLERGDLAQALDTARRALDQLEPMLGGLAEEEGALARGRHADVFAVGALAAARQKKRRDVLAFLESGRAGALLDALDGRQVLRWAELPEALRNAEADAKTAAARARQAYDQARKGGELVEIRAKARALEEAMDQARQASARIQREAKRAADLYYPRACTQEDIQRRLGADQALVLYGLCLDEALALVLTRDDDRLVSLGPVEPIDAACSTLPLDRPDENADQTLQALRALLVNPLALGDSVETVLVSPEGPLCYVPFGALFDAHAVALTPSGTTHVLLGRDERSKGTQVLALADPDYGESPCPGAAAVYRGGRQLVPLPASRAEAEAVGDVLLLGADANEAAFRKALAKHARWRAVHLACHGLVDAERPTLSSLALTPVDGEDGYLTALEVVRMQIPADLAVLSACESAKGRVVRGEGIVGLTRAFMYAGAPRVLCSLWKVDDDATRALMTRFYELWSPPEGEGLGAAMALRDAQAFVRDHPDHPTWKHPRYWAAWVLWGLP